MIIYKEFDWSLFVDSGTILEISNRDKKTKRDKWHIINMWHRFFEIKLSLFD